MEHFPGDLAFTAAGGSQYDHVGVGVFVGFPIKLVAEVDSWASGLWFGHCFIRSFFQCISYGVLWHRVIDRFA
jgi:hypothetical protein